MLIDGAEFSPEAMLARALQLEASGRPASQWRAVQLRRYADSLSLAEIARATTLIAHFLAQQSAPAEPPAWLKPKAS
jgi:hypothetical protein